MPIYSDAAWLDCGNLKKESESSKPVSRVLYPDKIGTVTIHLAPMLPSGSSGQPGNRPGALSSPIWPCSGRGLHGRTVTRSPVGSYPTISPLSRQVGAVCFCCTFRRVAPPGCYPASCPVEPGLSSPIKSFRREGQNRGGHPVYLTHVNFNIKG